MLAQLLVALPFHIAVPEGAQFTLYTYEDDGYLVTVYPPSRSDQPPPGEVPDLIRMSNAPAFVANALRIEFRRETFNRTSGHPSDPPEAVLYFAIDSFLTRLRYATRGTQVHRVSLQDLSWRLRYLNDDGSELEKRSGLVRGLRHITFTWSLIGINPTVWENIHSLSPDFKPPPWDDLRLDAQAALPHVGTAVVLAVACLEVFISHTLDQLASNSDVPGDIWKWATHRGYWLKDPTTNEQYDFLIRHFTGHSLKENPALWEAYKNLKDARNTFVHEGVAKVGGKVVSVPDAVRLVARMNDIINWVKIQLPTELRWLEFEPSVQFEFEQAILE